MILALRRHIARDIISGMAEGSTKSNFPLRLPTDLLDELKREAERRRTSANTLMVACLSAAVGYRTRGPNRG